MVLHPPKNSTCFDSTNTHTHTQCHWVTHTHTHTCARVHVHTCTHTCIHAHTLPLSLFSYPIAISSHLRDEVLRVWRKGEADKLLGGQLGWAEHLPPAQRREVKHSDGGLVTLLLCNGDITLVGAHGQRSDALATCGHGGREEEEGKGFNGREDVVCGMHSV